MVIKIIILLILMKIINFIGEEAEVQEGDQG